MSRKGQHNDATNPLHNNPEITSSVIKKPFVKFAPADKGYTYSFVIYIYIYIYICVFLFFFIRHHIKSRCYFQMCFILDVFHIIYIIIQNTLFHNVLFI